MEIDVTQYPGSGLLNRPASNGKRVAYGSRTVVGVGFQRTVDAFDAMH